MAIDLPNLFAKGENVQVMMILEEIRRRMHARYIWEAVQDQPITFSWFEKGGKNNGDLNGPCACRGCREWMGMREEVRRELANPAKLAAAWRDLFPEEDE